LWKKISLKRPVAQRGSILLAELVAILMVLEHCIAALKDGLTDINILSDSQTAVGILTLNWKSSNYIDTISDIKENIGTLMRYGIRTTLSWIPGHANIAGKGVGELWFFVSFRNLFSDNTRVRIFILLSRKARIFFP
jgi:hypothetical protein